MNVQEREQLSAFLQQLAQAQTGPKDEEAQALIAGTVAHQPDAAYLLVQRALILDGALKAAQSQIAQLKTQLEQPKPAPAATSFLDPNAWGRSPVAPVAAPMRQSPAQAPAFQAVPQAAAPAAGFQAPSFLTNMAMTAAGVAAGAMLFQGVSHMLGGHNDPSLPGSSSLHPADSVTENTVINNYFDTPADAGGGNADAGADDFNSVADAGTDNFDSSSDSA